MLLQPSAAPTIYLRQFLETSFRLVTAKTQTQYYSKAADLELVRLRPTTHSKAAKVTKNQPVLHSFPALVNGGGWRFQGTRSPSSLGLDDERREERCSLVHTVHCGQLGDAPSLGIA